MVEPQRRWASVRPHVCHVVVGLRLYANGPITRRVFGPLNLSLGFKVLIVVICTLISIIVGIVIFREPVTFVRLFWIAVTLSGIVGLKLTSS